MATNGRHRESSWTFQFVNWHDNVRAIVFLRLTPPLPLLFCVPCPGSVSSAARSLALIKLLNLPNGYSGSGTASFLWN